MNFITDTPVRVVAALVPSAVPYLGQTGLVLGYVHDFEPAALRDTLVRVAFPSGQTWDFDPAELEKEHS